MNYESFSLEELDARLEELHELSSELDYLTDYVYNETKSIYDEYYRRRTVAPA